jgi:hypothetical protein
MHPILFRLLVLALATAAPWAAADSLLSAVSTHLKDDPGGKSAFTFDSSSFASGADLSGLPIGVFDSGIGGLTVLEALLTADVFHNDDLKPAQTDGLILKTRASSTSAIRRTCRMATTLRWGKWTTCGN